MIFILLITILLSGCQTNIKKYSERKTQINYPKVKITKYVLPKQDLSPVWFKGFLALAEKGDSYPVRQMFLYQSSNIKNLKQLAVFKNSLGKFFVNPFNEKEIFFLSFDGERGIWKSNNFGDKWKKVFCGKAEKLVFYPRANVDFLLQNDMQGVQVFQSTDSGEHWEQVFSLKEIVEAKQLVINPSNPLHLLIPARNGLWQSIDGGKQWEQVFTGSEPARAIINSANPKIVYFTDRRALYSLTDGKTKKISLPGAPEDSEIYGLINRTRTNQIFIFALKEVEKFRYKTKIYQVEENKANQIASINNNNRILDLIFDSHNPNILYAFSYSEIYKLNLLGNLSHR